MGEEGQGHPSRPDTGLSGLIGLFWGKDQDPLKQLQVRGGDSSGEGGRDGHKGPTVTRVVTLSARPALTLDLSRIIYHLI